MLANKIAGKYAVPLFVSGAAALFLNACGGSGSANGTTISGSVVDGPVSGATVTVKNAANGNVLGSTTTNADGSYSITISYSGDVILEASGGSYADDNSVQPITLTGPMRAVLSANGGNATANITPLTTMAYTQAFHSGTAISASLFNTTAANIAAQFKLDGVNLVSTLPIESGTASNSYGSALRGLSRYIFSANAKLEDVVDTPISAKQLPGFSSAMTLAHNSADPASPVTYAFDSTAFNSPDSGAGDGTCGVTESGKSTVAFVFYRCVTGVPAGTCNGANANLVQTINSELGIVGGFISYSDVCLPGAHRIALQ
jgi:hypothetical protein